MPLSLYDVTVPTFVQILGSVSGLIEKADAHCTANKIAPGDIINARLHEDMLPFSYQVKSSVTHSIGALQALNKGVFSPDMTPSPDTFSALQEKVTSAIAALEALRPQDVNSYEGRDMRFALKEFHLDFTAENFLLSFSTPNFYFHATTTYDILRHKGVAIGKRNFVGKLRTK